MAGDLLLKTFHALMRVVNEKNERMFANAYEANEQESKQPKG